MPVEPKRVQAVFLAAVEIADPVGRSAVLDLECPDDIELRQRVEGLLRAHDESASFLEHPADGEMTGEFASALPPVSEVSGSPGTLIGPYKLLQLLGEGGMGAVWVAEQDQPVKRRVALKLIKAGMDSSQVLRRFEAERQALALMDHANIAKVFDAGTTPQGRPYFAMELIKGIPITKFCDQEHLTPRERLELFIPVCQAVQHAHQKGIIHRDLKPSNVMIALYDGKPVPKVIDFGVAKASGQKLSEDTVFTEVGQIVGTMEYMAPEQAELNNLDIDTRADIYSLGVILYELLTGSAPFTARQLRGAAFTEMLRMIREVEPPKPSTRLSSSDELPSIAANRKLEPNRLTRLVRGELDWIAMKALEKDRNRRYATANGFAMDLQRYLADEPVQACPPSTVYRVKKFVRRNRMQLTLAVALGMLLATGGAFAWYSDRQATQQRARLGQNAEAVAALLDQCEQALRADRADRAAIALDAAERRASDGGADAFADRLTQCRADLELLRELDAIDAFRWTWSGQRAPDPEAVVARWQTALSSLAVTTNMGREVEAAGRVNVSFVRDRVLTALDLWLANNPSPGLRAVLQSADPAPYRDAVRNALAAKDARAVADLARQPEALAQPARFAAAFGQLATVPKDRGRAVLESSLRSQPGNLLLLMALGFSYPFNKPEGASERVRWFQAAVAAHPTNAMALNCLGIALLDDGNPDRAYSAFRDAALLEPKSVIPHINMGNALRAKMNLNDAVAAYQQAIKIDAKSTAAHNALGIALWKKGDADGAIDAFRKAIAIDSNYVDALINLGVVFNDMKRDYDRAITCFKQALQLAPKSASAHYNLGSALWRKGDPDGAMESFRSAIRIDGNLAEAHCNLGAILCDVKRDYDGAITSIRKAIQLAPKYDKAHFNLGNALNGKGDTDGAIEAFRQAIQINGEYFAAHFNLGHALWRKGKLDDAIVAYREAIRINPKSARAHYSLGNGLLRKGDPDGAIVSIKEAARLNPNNADFHYGLGVVLCDHKRDYDGAISAFKEAIRLTPMNPNAHFNLANALWHKGKLVGAIAAYREAVRLDPKDAYLSIELARLLATGPDGVRDGKQAVELATRACELTGWKEPNYIDTLAAAYADTGDFDRAVEYQKKALSFLEFAKKVGKSGHEKLQLYEQKKPYRDTTLVPREAAPPAELKP